jgi:dTDP-4-dehydrorhamnose reductase
LRKYGEVEICGHAEVPERKYGTVYLCNGVTKTAVCEEKPELSRLVNVETTVDLAKKHRCIWLSSERVFNGLVKERGKGDGTSAVTEYGKQKVEAERMLLEMGAGILRVSKVIGYEMPLFEGWVQELKEGKTIRPFSNMGMAPVGITQVVEVLHKMGRERMTGLYQLSGDEDVGYGEIGVYLCLRMGKPIKLVQPVPAPVPHPYSTLKSDFDRPNSWDVIHEWYKNRGILNDISS